MALCQSKATLPYITLEFIEKHLNTSVFPDENKDDMEKSIKYRLGHKEIANFGGYRKKQKY